MMPQSIFTSWDYQTPPFFGTKLENKGHGWNQTKYVSWFVFIWTTRRWEVTVSSTSKFPQTVFSCRGSYGVGKGALKCLAPRRWSLTACKYKRIRDGPSKAHRQVNILIELLHFSWEWYCYCAMTEVTVVTYELPLEYSTAKWLRPPVVDVLEYSKLLNNPSGRMELMDLWSFDPGPKTIY